MTAPRSIPDKGTASSLVGVFVLAGVASLFLGGWAVMILAGMVGLGLSYWEGVGAYALVRFIIAQTSVKRD